MWKHVFLFLVALSMVLLLVGNTYLLYQRLFVERESAPPDPSIVRTVRQDEKWVMTTVQAEDRVSGRRVTVIYTVPAGGDVSQVEQAEWRAIQLLLGLPDEKIESSAKAEEKAEKEAVDTFRNTGVGETIRLPDLPPVPKGSQEWHNRQRQAEYMERIGRWNAEHQAVLERQLGRKIDLKNGRYADGDGELLPEYLRKRYMRWYVPREQVEQWERQEQQSGK